MKRLLLLVALGACSQDEPRGLEAPQAALMGTVAHGVVELSPEQFAAKQKTARAELELAIKTQGTLLAERGSQLSTQSRARLERELDHAATTLIASNHPSILESAGILLTMTGNDAAAELAAAK